MEQRTKTWWERWSETFQTEGDIDPDIAFGPGAPPGTDLGLLGDDLSGTRAVELGCGGAQFGLGLARRGADVVGIDIARAQLTHARAEIANAAEAPALVEGTVSRLPIADQEFDLAVSAWAFQWVPDLGAVLGEAHRVLRPGGRLVFSVDHPFYKQLDPETGEVVRSYFADEPERAHSEELDAEMVLYSRGIGETVSLLRDAGFVLETVREPGFEDPAAYVEEFGRYRADLMAKVPPTVVYAARKQARPRSGPDT